MEPIKYSIAERILMQPTKVQAEYLEKCCAMHRIGWNWALGEWGRQYEAWKADNSLSKPSAMSLQKKFRTVRDEEYPWWSDVFANSHVGAINKNLDKAMKNFFAGRAKYPRFKKRGRDDTSFYLANVEGGIKGRRFKVPQPRGNKPMWIKLRKDPRFEGKVNSYTVSRVAGKWYVSISYEIDEVPYTTSGERGIVGIDINISEIVTSDGERVAVPKAIDELQTKLTRLQRRLKRKRGNIRKLTPGSRKWDKTVLQVQKLHKRIGDIRSNYIHQFTARIARTCEAVGIEELNVKGMMQNHNLARSVGNIGAAEIRRQLTYKCGWSGAELRAINQFEHPSTQTCSQCGYRKTGSERMKLGQSEYRCSECGLEIDRDLNAAINLANWASAPTPEPGESQAGGDSSDGPKVRKRLRKLRIVETGTRAQQEAELAC